MTLTEIIAISFENNDTLINLYNGIIKQFDRVCEDLDKVFCIGTLTKEKENSKTTKKDKFEKFMNDLSLETISPLTIKLYNETISKQIKKISNEINTQCKTSEDINRLNACKNNFINLQNETQTVRHELNTGLSHVKKEDLAFKDHDGQFKKDDNYLPLVKDEYNRNYLHYTWKHFEGFSAKDGSLETIKEKLLEYAGNDKKNIELACKERDAYGLTPLCYVLIEAFDSGINNSKVENTLYYVLKYFGEELGVSTQLSQEELQAIYDYFQITKNLQGNKRDYNDFIKTMDTHIQKNNSTIPSVVQANSYKPQMKFNARTHTEYKTNGVSVETFLSDEDGYKDKVGDFVDSLFDEVYTTNRSEFNKYFVGEDEEYENFEKFKERYMVYMYTNNGYNVGAVISKIINIKANKQLKYIPDNSSNKMNRNNYCESLFIKALQKQYTENNNPDIMFKFLSDFCEKDMGIKMDKNNYIQIIKYFLNNLDEITDDVKQNIKSLIRYIIEDEIVNSDDFQISTINTNTFIQQIITKDSEGVFGKKEQELIQDIILTASDNNINFGNTAKDLVDQLQEKCFNGNSEKLSSFEIVKNLILSGNVKETENFSQYSGLKDDEKVKLQQILTKTVAITKIIKEGKQDCSKLKDAVVKFVGDNTGLTIEDIAKIKVNHKSISKFCEGESSGNKKCAYYSWFLNKLVVNNYIASTLSGNTNEGSETSVLLSQSYILPKNIVLDTYDEFDNYKNNTVKKIEFSTPYKVFQVRYMNSDTNTVTGKRSNIHYQNIKTVYDDEQQQDDYGCSSVTQNKTLRSIVGSINNVDINEDLKKYYLQQQVALNQEKSDRFKRFCTVFDLINANTLLFNAVGTRSQTTQGDYTTLK